MIECKESTGCVACGVETKRVEECFNGYGLDSLPVCVSCSQEELSPRLLRVRREVLKATDENVHGLNRVHLRVRDTWPGGVLGAAPSRSVVSGVGVFLALRRERVATVLIGVRGGFSLVVSTLPPDEVKRERHRRKKSKVRIRGWRAEASHLLGVLRREGPAELRPLADKVVAHGGYP